MKSLFTLIGVFIVLAAMGALFYGGYLGLIYLWEVYAGLDEVIRIVLLSAMAAFLLSAFVIAAAIKSAGQAAHKSQLSEPKLRLYEALVESCRPVFAPADRPAQRAYAGALASLAAIDAEMQILAAGPVLATYGKLAAALRDRDDPKQINSLWQRLVKSIRRDLGHGSSYDETKFKLMIVARPLESRTQPQPGAST